MTSDPVEPRPPLLSYAALFLQFLGFGALAFGGPVAQIAMIRRKLIDEDQWMSSARFNRLLAVLQALPGPEAHELCVHLGMRAKGRIGGVLAGLGFMLPGFVLMLVLAWLYFSIGVKSNWMSSAFIGVQIAVLAVIVRAAHRIGLHVMVDRSLWIIGAVSCAASLLGVSFWLILPAAGLTYALAQRSRRLAAATLFMLMLSIGLAARYGFGGPSAPPVAVAGVVPMTASVAALFFTGLKAGLLTFGGAYTAIPIMRADATRGGWIGDGQFLDGVALAVDQGQGLGALGNQDARPVGIGEEGHRRDRAHIDHQVHALEIGQRRLAEILHPGRGKAAGTARIAGEEGVGHHPDAGRRQSRGLRHCRRARRLAA